MDLLNTFWGKYILNMATEILMIKNARAENSCPFQDLLKKKCCKTDISLKQLINLTASATLFLFLAVFVVFPNRIFCKKS